MPPNKGLIQDPAVSLLVGNITNNENSAPLFLDKAATKDDGMVYHSYVDVHNAVIEAAAKIGSTFQADKIFAFDDSVIIATILRSELDLNDVPITVLPVNKDSLNNPKNGWPEGKGGVLLVTLVDDNRCTTSKYANVLKTCYEFSSLLVVSAFSKLKEKRGSLPCGTQFCFGFQVLDVAQRFPWQTKSSISTITEHNKKAERCTSIAAFKKKRDEKLAMKRREERMDVFNMLVTTENPDVSMKEEPSNDLDNIHRDLLSADHITKQLIEDSKRGLYGGI